MPPKPESPVPSRLGPYVVLEPLAPGGMAEVFLCHDPSLDRKVVVKRLPSGSDTELLNRFQREASLLSGMAHPGYAHVFRYWMADDRPAMAMEFVDGLTLREIIHRCPRLPVDAALCLAWSLAEALRHAHLHGIVHRDVKPSNIMVTFTGQVKLLDFGVARFVRLSELTLTGSVVGTTAYMSPEQARGDAVDERSDLFSLGLVLHECLTGRNPFRRELPEATLLALQTDKMPPLWRDRAGAPLRLAFLLGACLRKTPRRRPRDATDFLRRLQSMWGRRSLDREAYLAALLAALRAGRPFEEDLPRRGFPMWPLLFPAFAGLVWLVLAVMRVANL